jgi:2,5-diketo-D-gluconate reductase B
MNTADIPVFSRDNDQMPVLGLGTFQLTGETCRKAVSTALELGYNHIDTARMYQNEQQVAAGIKDSGVERESIFLTTKLQMGQLDEQGVRESCDTSLKQLDTDYVDLLLIHWPEDDVPLAETLGAMAKLREAGKIKHLGISNFTLKWIKKAVDATEVPIFCNQVEYHPYLSQEPVLNFCRKEGMALVAYSPLARGQVAEDERFIEIGEKYDKTPAQVALRWLLDQDGVVAIPKGSSEDHISENLEIFDFELDESDLDKLDGLEDDRRLIDPQWSPDWDT